jgi:hypothetical protein
MSENSGYSIGVVDYLGRFEDYFIPLIKDLIKVFPDKEIICVLNGHHDQRAQMEYLKKASIFLSGFSNVRYFSFDEHQSLAKCWNRIILMSSVERSLILNDDLSIDPYFRTDFERALIENYNFFTINKSWSHFLISKSIVRKVGWFEERLLGIGWEDGDYILRMAEQNIMPISIDCLGIRNFVAPPNNASWSKISNVSGKYSEINKEFFGKKWYCNHLDREFGRRRKGYKINFMMGDERLSGELKDGMETPIFYPLDLLDNIDDASYRENSAIVRNYLLGYYKVKNILLDRIKKIVRFIK